MVARGAVQYRDFLDNHAPLFYAAWSPLVRCLPAKPITLFILRGSMNLPWLALLIGVYATARSIARPHLALLTTIATASLPGMLPVSVEFRPDLLWAALWMLAIAVLSRRRATLSRAIVAGLLAGLAACVSLKTAGLLLGFFAARAAFKLRTRRAGISGPLTGRAEATTPGQRPGFFELTTRKPARCPNVVESKQIRQTVLKAKALQNLQPPPTSSQRQGPICDESATADNAVAIHRPAIAPLLKLAMFLLAAAAPLGLVIAWLAHQNALAQAIQQTVTRNWKFGQSGSHLSRVAIFAAAVLVIAIIVALRPRLNRRTSIRVQLIAIAAMTALTFFILWPIWQRQDALPVLPLCMIGGLAIATAVPVRKYFRRGRIELAMILITVISLPLAWRRLPPRDIANAYLVRLDSVSRLATEHDCVADLKGESIFYQRALPLVYETLTRRELKEEPALDDGPERLAAAQPIAAMSYAAHFPPLTLRWIRERYIVASQLGVPGHRFWPAGGTSQTFLLPREDDYVFDRADAVTIDSATIDGQPVASVLHLSAGTHTLTLPAPLASPMAIVLKRAADVGLKVDWSKPPP